MAALLPPINHPSSIRHRARRRFKDKLAKHLIGIGGIGVIIAITLIFAYLLYVVVPLFMPGKIETGADYTLPHDSGTSTLYLAMEEQAEVGVRFESNGQTTFFYTHDGKIISQLPLNLPQSVTVTSFAAGTGASRVVAFGLSDGSAKVLKHEYDVSYPDNVRIITPRISYPLGEAPIQIDSSGRPLAKLAVQSNEEQATVVSLTNDSRLLLTTLTIETSMMDDETTIETNTIALENAPSKISHLLLDKEQRVVYAATTAGTIARFDISDHSAPILEEQVTAVNSGNR
ncbi:MAG: phosphate ABC transporter permease, partial [Pseudomonadota bacterium]|nr:phosphate ABC transporter permease [Pseudomonadota bacterium]